MVNLALPLSVLLSALLVLFELVGKDLELFGTHGPLESLGFCVFLVFRSEGLSVQTGILEKGVVGCVQRSFVGRFFAGDPCLFDRGSRSALGIGLGLGVEVGSGSGVVSGDVSERRLLSVLEDS